jgi:epoxide hydrolase-like predicted phosphatase
MHLTERDVASVIFDLGGVLIEQPLEDIFGFCAAYLRVDKTALQRAHKRYAPDFQKGTISEKTFWERVCSEVKREQPDGISLWGEAFSHSYRERAENFSLAANLHRHGYRVGLLSDTEAPAVTFFLGRRYEFFNFLVFSCLEGATKPEPRIYRIALERSGTPPQQTVFIDDAAENVRGAEELGIKSILYETPSRLQEELLEFGLKID